MKPSAGSTVQTGGQPAPATRPTSEHEARVVEDELNVDVLGRLRDLVEVARSVVPQVEVETNI